MSSAHAWLPRSCLTEWLTDWLTRGPYMKSDNTLPGHWSLKRRLTRPIRNLTLEPLSGNTTCYDLYRFGQHSNWDMKFDPQGLHEALKCLIRDVKVPWRSFKADFKAFQGLIRSLRALKNPVWFYEALKCLIGPSGALPFRPTVSPTQKIKILKQTCRK